MSQNYINSEFYNNNGFLLVKNLINYGDIKKIKKRLGLLSRKQKDGRGLSEPGLKKSLIHSLHKDKYLNHEFCKSLFYYIQ